MDVAIFPGHAGKDPGAIEPADDDKYYTVESVITYSIAGYLIQYLNSVGIDTCEGSGSFEQRVIDTAGCKCGVSIHADISKRKHIHGHHCIYYPRSKEGHRLARLIDAHLSTTYPHSRQPHPDNRSLAILKNTVFPCVVVECGFLSNVNEEAWLWNREHQRSIAFDIGSAVRQWLFTLDTENLIHETPII